MASDASKVRNLVLVGRTGNGKSSTGNCILGLENARPRRRGPAVQNPGFRAGTGSGGVTQTSEMRSGTINGQIINVIDTPGLFDASTAHQRVSEEIVKCIQLAKQGVHAFLAVISTKNRFSQEEERVFRVLKGMFGDKTLDYMIVVFTTNEDDFQDASEFEEDYLSTAPPGLTNLLDACKHRKLMFDIKTKNPEKQARQRSELLVLVNQVVAQNHGKPYTNELFSKVQKLDQNINFDAGKELEALRISNSNDMMKKFIKQNDRLKKELRDEVMAILKEEIKKEKKRSKDEGDFCCSIL